MRRWLFHTYASARSQRSPGVLIQFTWFTPRDLHCERVSSESIGFMPTAANNVGGPLGTNFELGLVYLQVRLDAQRQKEVTVVQGNARDALLPSRRNARGAALSCELLGHDLVCSRPIRIRELFVPKSPADNRNAPEGRHSCIIGG